MIKLKNSQQFTQVIFFLKKKGISLIRHMQTSNTLNQDDKLYTAIHDNQLRLMFTRLVHNRARKKSLTSCGTSKFPSIRQITYLIHLDLPNRSHSTYVAPRLLEQMLYLVLFSLYPRIFLELRDKRDLKIYNFDLKASEPH